jgi:hypothetical protein
VSKFLNYSTVLGRPWAENYFFVILVFVKSWFPTIV